MKHLLLNKDNVLIDIVDTVKPVMKNRNQITVLCGNDEAQGYIGSDNDTIYAKMGSQFLPSFYDIARIVAVDKVPKLVAPLKYKYLDDFELNEDSYPDTNRELTSRTSAVEDAILEISEIIYAEG